MTLYQLLGGILVTVVYLAMAVALSWQVTLILAIGALAIIALSWRQTAKGKIFGAVRTQANQEFLDEVTEQVSAAKLIKGYAAQNAVIIRFRKYYETLAHAIYQAYFNQAKLKALVDTGMAAMMLVTIYAAVVIFKIDIAGLMIILFIFYRISPRISNIQTLSHNLNIYIPAMDNVDAIVREAAKLKDSDGNRLLEKITKGIYLENVDFSYESGKTVLEGINVEIPKGKTTAIIGSSGVGKSTIVDLIIGLAEPQKGEVLLDGFPISQYDSRSWKSKIGYVAQDTVLFNDTVEANITWSYPGATRNDIIEAAKLAYAHEFIEQLPEGYNTVIGARGVKLSGGQRQRLALARAIIRKPELLILDEATSALDAVSEKKIQTAVEALSQSMTILTVTHRLATIKNADIIYVMENGKLVEQGDWDTLVKGHGRFKDLKQLQMLD